MIDPSRNCVRDTTKPRSDGTRPLVNGRVAPKRLEPLQRKAHDGPHLRLINLGPQPLRHKHGGITLSLLFPGVSRFSRGRACLSSQISACSTCRTNREVRDLMAAKVPCGAANLTHTARRRKTSLASQVNGGKRWNKRPYPYIDGLRLP